ncbi:ribosome maturation factor RimP [Gluconacetobacter diazotrophicus]|uniref:Ribosome maturation factor RimP n=1 Tax=Gluconacetobacter diazotrophicus TaxID=33996 RepID=A0A7W4FD84_GLUDI|nr:ribosome maturation factor RimP [Gluconacetobacter diazotrophicus]MBB2155618.1 ribosome maturation factor RimP [Gluconacetobacter diazotrophicus]
MDADLPYLTGLDAKVAAIVAPVLAEMGFELVRVAILGRESPTVQIMADRADGTLIAIEDCEQISHAVGAVLDVEDPLPGAWTLEVSSAGIDRPLTRAKDWTRFAGHLAKAEVNIPIDGRKRFSGILLGAEDGFGRLRLEDGTEVALPLSDMRRARLVLTDELIAASAHMMRAPGGAPEEGEEDTTEAAPEGAGKSPKPGRRPARKTH